MIQIVALKKATPTPIQPDVETPTPTPTPTPIQPDVETPTPTPIQPDAETPTPIQPDAPQFQAIGVVYGKVKEKGDRLILVVAEKEYSFFAYPSLLAKMPRDEMMYWKVWPGVNKYGSIVFSVRAWDSNPFPGYEVNHFYLSGIWQQWRKKTGIAIFQNASSKLKNHFVFNHLPTEWKTKLAPFDKSLKSRKFFVQVEALFECDRFKVIRTIAPYSTKIPRYVGKPQNNTPVRSC